MFQNGAMKRALVPAAAVKVPVVKLQDACCCIGLFRAGTRLARLSSALLALTMALRFLASSCCTSRRRHDALAFDGRFGQLAFGVLARLGHGQHVLRDLAPSRTQNVGDRAQMRRILLAEEGDRAAWPASTTGPTYPVNIDWTV